MLNHVSKLDFEIKQHNQFFDASIKAFYFLFIYHNFLFISMPVSTAGPSTDSASRIQQASHTEEEESELTAIRNELNKLREEMHKMINKLRDQEIHELKQQIKGKDQEIQNLLSNNESMKDAIRELRREWEEYRREKKSGKEKNGQYVAQKESTGPRPTNQPT